MKISDLEFKESLLTKLSENRTSKICGGASGSATQASEAAMQENLASATANAAKTREYQDQLTAVNTDAQYKMKSDQLLQQLVQQIKTQ